MRSCALDVALFDPSDVGSGVRLAVRKRDTMWRQMPKTGVSTRCDFGCRQIHTQRRHLVNAKWAMWACVNVCVRVCMCVCVIAGVSFMDIFYRVYKLKNNFSLI